MYGPKNGETMDEARLREAREKAEREKRLKEIEEIRAKVTSHFIFLLLYAPDFSGCRP